MSPQRAAQLEALVKLGAPKIMVERAHILAEITRTAEENGGVPLGRSRFQAATGIKEGDWCGRYWLKWSDAVAEAGLQPNRLNQPYDEEFLLERFATLIKELQHFPTRAELKMKWRSDPTFPSPNVFTRFGPKGQLATKLVEYCRAHSDAVRASR